MTDTTQQLMEEFIGLSSLASAIWADEPDSEEAAELWEAASDLEQRLNSRERITGQEVWQTR